MKTRKPDALEAKLLADPAVRAEFDALTPEYEIARMLITARAQAGLSQSEVAARMDTTQSVIARMESGRRMPNLRTVERYAKAVGGRLSLRIEPRAG